MQFDTIPIANEDILLTPSLRQSFSRPRIYHAQRHQLRGCLAQLQPERRPRQVEGPTGRLSSL
eukprot:7178828-Heterocapsa_arctica.AAC.1